MRVAIYSRVSTDEQTEGYSIDAQLRVCREWAGQHGHLVMAEYVEEGKSGSTIKKRQYLAELLEDVQQKKFDLVVVHKLDRISRNLKDTLQIISVFEASSVALASVTESFDFSTPIGRMVLTLLVSFAQFFLDNLSTEIKKGNLEKAKQGYYPGKIPPVGYRIDGHQIVAHQDEKRLVVRAYDLLFSDLYTLKQIRAMLAAEGLFIYSQGGNKNVEVKREITPIVLLRTLKNPVYKGVFVYGGHLYTGKHEALVSQEIWDKCQRIIAGRAKSGRGAHARSAKYVFGGGMLECSRCGKRLFVQRSGAAGGIWYVCDVERRGHSCEGGKRYIREELLVSQMTEVIEKIILPPDWIDEIKRQSTDPSRVDPSERRRKALNERRHRLEELYLDGRFTPEEFKAKDTQIEIDIASLPIAPISTRQIIEASDMVVKLPVLWEHATGEEKRALLKLMFRAIVVDTQKKRIIALRPMPSFAMLFRVDGSGIITIE